MATGLPTTEHLLLGLHAWQLPQQTASALSAREAQNVIWTYQCEGKRTSKRTPTQRRQSGGAMWDDMEGLMSNSADTTCTSTSTCTW